ERWHPHVELVQIFDPHRRLADPLVEYLKSVPEAHVFVLIAEVEPEHPWQRLLQNQRGAVLARALRRRTDTVVCRLRFRVGVPVPHPSAPGRAGRGGPTRPSGGLGVESPSREADDQLGWPATRI
ncbi:MAG: family permease, partial [Sphaerisporangium sp.]|nr:family permease [Sphaerisporangium sp.]